MQIDGYTFIFVCDIEPVRDPKGLIQQFMPQARYKNAGKSFLNAYGNGPFCKFGIPNIPSGGVYIIDVGAQAMYVGETMNLAKRFNMGFGNISPKNCYKGGQNTNCRINNLIYSAAHRGEAVSLWFFATEDFKKVEATLRSVRKFGWNLI